MFGEALGEGATRRFVVFVQPDPTLYSAAIESANAAGDDARTGAI